MIYDFDIYCGKGNIDPELQGLQKCSAVVTKLNKTSAEPTMAHVVL